jgi:hypothetical protein
MKKWMKVVLIVLVLVALLVAAHHLPSFESLMHAIHGR